VRLHPNAKTTPLARQHLVRRVLDEGLPIAQVAGELGISARTGYKWLSRYRHGGAEALQDRTSRPYGARHAPRKAWFVASSGYDDDV